MPRSTLLPPRPPREAMRFSIQPTAMRVESRPDVHFSASPSRADGGLPRRAQGCAEGLESPSASLGGLCGESSGEVKPNVNRGCVTKPRRARRSSGQCSRLGVFVRDPFTFDDEGQLFDRSGTAFTFDDEHRLVQAGTDQYLYDGAGNRLAAWRRGAAGTRYVYDVAGNLLAEANGSNQILRYYVYGQGLLAMVTPSGASYSYHYDATGNTVAMTDGSQAVVNRYAYTPYGQIVGKAESVPQPFQYVGQYGVMAEPNGFYYMRARYYDPEVGRFVSEDPIGFEGGDVNLYAYVQNNPVNRVDPTGLYWFRQSWHTEYVVGRRGSLVEPGGLVSRVIEKYVPAGRTFGEIHDAFVGAAIRAGVPDPLANIPSMIPMFGAAVVTEVLRTVGVLDQPTPPAQPTQPTPCK